MNRKMSLMVLVFGIAAFASACSGAREEAHTQIPIAASPTPESHPHTAVPTAEIPPIQPTRAPRPYAPAQAGGAFLTDKNEFFAASGNCVVCHKQNIDEAGNNVSFGDFWRGTIMANSALDPYYLAGVSMNIARFPEYGADIESKCSTCHMPMAHTSDAFSEGESLIFGAEGYLDPQHPLHKLAADGVSCSACHQIQDQDLGEFTSFSGGFVIDQNTPMGARVLYGRFNVSQPSQRMMAMSSGFVAQQSDHLLESEICATCHNLYTHYVTEDGSFSEAWFPEQTPYTEWLHSEYATLSTCQDCHMPPAEGAVVLSTLGPAGPRVPFAQHSFVGGNAYLLGVLNNFGGELAVQAGPEHFEAAIDRTLSYLRTETAQLEISPTELDGSSLGFDVTTSVLTGHKFPSGYPSRRAWLHITVKDGNGEVVFESGGVGTDGAILGNANDENSLAFEPHYDQITAADQVQIYETIIADVENKTTTILLAAAFYLKDNRLLPNGFEKTTASDDIKPHGMAFGDENFSAGGDTVKYLIEIGGATGPFTVEAELLYQSISYRWAMDLRAYETEQALLFSDYYQASPNLPVQIASQVASSE